MSYQAIASKFRRALRNGTGASFTLDQLHLMADAGILNQLAQLEADELRSQHKVPRTSSPRPAGAPDGDIAHAVIANVLSSARRRK